MRAIVLAGGAGSRLRPVTGGVPKALALIGGELPILGIILRQLAAAGFTRATLAVNRRSQPIVDAFGDGAAWGLAVDYSVEEVPLGTVGPLTLIGDLPADFLVMNGDLLSDVGQGAVLEAHLAAGNDVTVAVCRHRLPIAYGVVRSDGERRLAGFVEKPTVEIDVNMGIYGMRRSVIERLPRGEPCGFDELLQAGLARRDRIGVFPWAGQWLDVGCAESYARANRLWPSLRSKLLP